MSNLLPLLLGWLGDLLDEIWEWLSFRGVQVCAETGLKVNELGVSRCLVSCPRSMIPTVVESA